MGVGTEDLKFRVLAEVAGTKAVKELKETVDSVAESAKFLTEGVKILGVAFGVKEVIEFGKGILENADQLGKLSQKTGVAVETLAGLQGAAQLSDVSMEQLGKGLNKLSLNIVEASNGNQDLAGQFRMLGISTKDSSGNLKTSGDVIRELSDKFHDMQDGPQKAAVAIKLFGKSGADLIPLLNQGSEEMERFGLAIDQDFAARAQTFNDSIKEIGINLKNNAIVGLQAILPTLQEVAGAFDDLTKGQGDTIGFFQIVGEASRILSIGIVTSFTAIKEIIDGAITGFREAYAFLKGNDAEVSRLDAGLKKRIQDADAAEAKFINGIKKNSLIFGEGSTDEILNRQKQDTAPKKSFGSGTPEVTGENEKVLRSFDEKINKMKAEIATMGQSNAARQAAILISELESKGIVNGTKYYAEYTAKIKAATAALETAKEKQTAVDFTRKQGEEIELEKLQIQNYALSSAELKKLTESRQLDNQASEATLKFTKEGKIAYLEATEAIKAQKAELVDIQEQQKQTWSVGAKEAFRDYLENARDIAAQTKSLFSTAFKDMEDSLVDFVKTGKLNFQKFADDVITELIRIQVRAVIVQSITGLQSLGSLFTGSGAAANGAAGANTQAAGFTASASEFADGGIMTSAGKVPLRRYAGGGIANSAQLALFGEGSKAEAFVPLPDGRRIPVDMKGSQGGNTIITVSVNTGEGGVDSSKGSDSKAQQLGKMISQAIRNQLVQEKRPGGLLYGGA